MTHVSIIMSAGDRHEHLRNTLIGWSRIDYPDFDFTIIENGSKKTIRPIVEEFREKLPLRFFKNESLWNVNRVWNKYGREASGEYVIFAMQDEIVSHKDIVQKMIETSSEVRSSIFTYFMNESETSAIDNLPWQDDPTIIPLPFTDQTTAGLISHIHGNFKKNWEWFGWFRDDQKGHLWLDQDVHLREVALNKAALTPKDVYCLHQFHPVFTDSDSARPGYHYSNELQARLLEPAERDAA